MTSPSLSTPKSQTNTNSNRSSPSSSDTISDDRSSYEQHKTALAAVEWGLQHEYQIKELEAKLANDLSNSRAIHNLIVEALANLEGNTQRVSRALTRHIPHIHSELHGALDRLAELEARFPLVREQVRAVQRAYEQGRSKAQTLTADLEWTHAPLTERLHRKLFTRSAPVSTLEAVLTRLAFLVVLILCAWQLAGALDGAYRAYRHRLVWGDKLIS